MQAISWAANIVVTIYSEWPAHAGTRACVADHPERACARAVPAPPTRAQTSAGPQRAPLLPAPAPGFMIVIIFALYVGYATSNLTTSQLDSAVTGLDTLPGKAVGTWGPCEPEGGAASMGAGGGPPAPAAVSAPQGALTHPSLNFAIHAARSRADAEKLQKFGVTPTTYPWNNKQDEHVSARWLAMRQMQTCRRQSQQRPTTAA